MFFPKLQLTNSGRALIVKALAGETLTFTRLAIGTGDDPGDIESMNELVDEMVSIDISSIKKGDGVATLEGSFDNSQISAGFYAKELGVFADDPDDGEILYAYSNSKDYPAYIPTGSSTSFERITLRVLVAVGDAETVEAKIGEFAGYATREELDAHEKDTENPHQTSAEQVGLGNVPNVTTNNQTPTFSALTTLNPDTIPLQNITSGETLSVMLGKIRNMIARLISHLTASNPHNITAQTLGVGEIVSGSYTGTGRYGSTSKNALSFKSQPRLLIVQPKTNSSHADYGGFMAIRGTTILRAGGLSDDVSNAESQIQLTWGTTVSWYSTTDAYFQQNASGWVYNYLAIL